MSHRTARILLVSLLSLSACLAPEPTSLGITEPGSGPTVTFDVYHQPFPDLPLPNDFATVYDADSPTLRIDDLTVAGS